MIRDCPELTDEEFIFFSELIYKKAGIHLNKDKKSLIQSRLFRRLLHYGFNNFSSYMEMISTDSKEKEIEFFVNALTTNKTEFFREKEHFTFLDIKFINELLSSKIKNSDSNILYIWSAACSSGEEVYSLAMHLEQIRRFHPHFDYRILGSDINTEVLNNAKNGIYNRSELGKKEDLIFGEYFSQGKGQNAGLIKVNDTITSKVKFRHHNLMSPEFPVNIHFDIIFLRNVLIYFDKETIETVIGNLKLRLRKHGFLIIGHADSLASVNHGLNMLEPSIYKKVT